MTKTQRNKKEDKSMNYFPKKTYCRSLVPNYEMVDETISQSNIFYSGLKKNMLRIPVFTGTYKSMKKL